MWSNKVKDYIDDRKKISGHDIPIKRGGLVHGDLKFWQKNPRIYSIVHASDDPLDQTEIQVELQGHDHVKELYKAISHHQGLINPIVVIDKSFEVIEGNSRLAAYRLLAQKDPVKYGTIPCEILPSTVDDKIIYSYLNQEHIQGKTKWSPYEQAGVIYRLVKDGASFDSLSKEMGISKTKASSMNSIYEFMVKHGEDKPNRYSFYEVYLSNRAAKQRRHKNPELDIMIVKEIQETTDTAQEFRAMLPIVCQHEKQFNKFLAGKQSISSAYDELEKEGKTDDLVRRLQKIRNQLQAMDKDEFDKLNAKAQKDAEYQLKRLITLAQNLKKTVYG